MSSNFLRPTRKLPIKTTDQHGRTNLTPRQKEIYEWIVEKCLDGNPPSLRELAFEFGLTGVSGASYHVELLIRKGWLTKEEHSRSYRPTVPALSILPNGGGYEIATTGRVSVTAAELAKMVALESLGTAA